MSESALEAQQALVEETLPLVFQTFDQAIADGMEKPVVMIVDCEDELGGQIARGWLGDEAIDEAIALHHAEAAINEDDEAAQVCAAAFARAIPWEACREELIEAFPYLAEALKTPPPEEAVLVVGVTAGGASALSAPFSAR